MCGEQFLKIKYHFFFFVLLLWIGGQEMVHNLYKFNHHAGCRFGKNEAKNKLNPHIKTMPVTRLGQMKRYMSGFCLHILIE